MQNEIAKYWPMPPINKKAIEGFSLILAIKSESDSQRTPLNVRAACSTISHYQSLTLSEISLLNLKQWNLDCHLGISFLDKHSYQLVVYSPAAC